MTMFGTALGLTLRFSTQLNLESHNQTGQGVH